MPLVMKKAVHQRVTACWSCHATLSDVKSLSFSLFAELLWLSTVRHLGQSPHLAWPMQPKDGKHGLILPWDWLVRQSVLAGEQTGRWERKAGMNFPSPQPPWEPFDVGWLISAHALHWYKALPSHHPNSHCYQTCHTKNPHTIFITFVFFFKGTANLGTFVSKSHLQFASPAENNLLCT